MSSWIGSLVARRFPFPWSASGARVPVGMIMVLASCVLGLPRMAVAAPDPGAFEAGPSNCWAQATSLTAPPGASVSVRCTRSQVRISLSFDVLQHAGLKDGDTRSKPAILYPGRTARETMEGTCVAILRGLVRAHCSEKLPSRISLFIHDIVYVRDAVGIQKGVATCLYAVEIRKGKLLELGSRPMTDDEVRKLWRVIHLRLPARERIEGFQSR